MSLILQNEYLGPLSKAFNQTGYGYSQSGNIGNAAYPVANKAFLYPVHLEDNAIFDAAVWHNGGTSGSSDFGIYHPNGTRLASVGGVSNTATNTFQVASFTSEVTLTPGVYYAAIACDTTSQFFSRQSPTLQWMALFGIREATSAYPLPSTIAMVTVSSNYICMFGMRRDFYA